MDTLKKAVQSSKAKKPGLGIKILFLGRYVSVLCTVAAVIFSCNGDDPAPTRSFLMGFTPFPYDISLDAVNYTYEKISTEGDMVTHHFDNGIPWVEALNGDPFPDNITNDLAFRKANTPTGHAVCVAVAPLKSTRDGMATYRGSADDMPLPSPWDTYTFANAEVKTAYVNYCKYLIDYFNPSYFNMAVEANLLYALSPDKYDDFVGFHGDIYAQLKALYPDIKIFTSVTGADLLPNFVYGEDYAQQQVAALRLLEHSDLYGISFYPYMSTYKTDPIPDDTFDKLFSLIDKPIAIAETGYPAQSFSINVNGVDVQMSGDEEKQERFYRNLLTACSKYDAVFVTQFAVRDYDQLWEDLGSKNDITIAWRDTGLYSETGQPRKAQSVWKSYFDREKK